VLYKLSVTREILKQIYIAESLQPPTAFSAIQNACTTIWSRASSVAFWRQAAVNGELAHIGVYALEAH
jgi:F-type H+-transporting ATPase subunit g